MSERPQDFAQRVWTTAHKVGRSPPSVADAILGDLFPHTADAARDEGAFAMLRKGVIDAVSGVLRSIPAGMSQGDFAAISVDFHPLVEKLKSGSYFVECVGEQVPVADLIRRPVWLDDARRHMRRKGEECIAEADRLDELYAAVTDEPAPVEQSVAA